MDTDYGPPSPQENLTPTPYSLPQARAERSPVCEGSRFVTGGGFLAGKKHFVIAFRDGDLDWGHLRYGDKAAGVKITADQPFTDAEVYSVPNADGGGTLTGETSSGSFQSTIIDAGEPGRNDWFELHTPGVTGAAGNLEGGNIQVHKACKTH